MRGLRFEWDERKATANRRKHGVPFDEARTVFLDEDALQIPDPDHSDEEDRFIMLGISARLRVWLKATRPILEAFFHARFFLEMAVRYGEGLESPPNILPSGWAAFLYLYDLR